MKKPRMLAAAVCTIALVAGPVTLVSTQAGAAPAKVSAAALLSKLTIRSEAHSNSYSRTKFKLWVDADHDGEDTRAEVLKAESKTKVNINSNGTVKTGWWVSLYDGKTITVGSKLDIDHLVPLAEAWASGASKWSAQKRTAYANDLGYGASLISVSKHENRSKGDNDPTEYLPPKVSYRCTYVRNWIAVKYHWHLSIDKTEKKTLTHVLHADCSTMQVAKPGKPNLAKLVGSSKPATSISKPTPTATPAPVNTPTTTPPPPPSPVASATPTPVATSTPTATPAATPTATPTPTPTATASPSAYYANCDAVRAAGKAPLYAGQPGYRSGLDRDGDGVACEN